MYLLLCLVVKLLSLLKLFVNVLLFICCVVIVCYF